MAQNLADPVPLLRDLIRCASVTPTEAGVMAMLAGTLEALGFTVTRLRFEGGNSYPVDNLFATRGKGGRHLLFAGHTDVVPPGDAALWTHAPFAAEESDGLIYGRGAADMKSGIAAFVAAVSRAVNDGSADKGTLSLLITNDEEADAVNGTVKALDWAIGHGNAFDFAIVGEPSATERVGDSIKIGRRGSLNGRIVVTGVQGHVAYPDRARNPLPVAGALVVALSGKLDDGTEHFPPSNLEFTSVDVGNKTSNVIPASVELRFNVRSNDLWTPQSLASAILETIANQDAAGCDIRFELAGPPSSSFLSPLGDAVELLASTIAAKTGVRPEYSTGGGTSDARFIAPYCPVVEFGLPGPTMHKVDEHVRIADVEALTGLYAAFIGRYFGG
ncbi:MAG TPA: succinyl-diaminopimelate desuccinylase [Devosia sp.]|nr:succinyl-diaminopimelate desuccinylase [Devosia sp.]